MNIELILQIVSFAVLLIVIFLVYRLVNNRQTPDNTIVSLLSDNIKHLQDQLGAIRGDMAKNAMDSTNVIQKQMQQSNVMVRTVTQSLTELNATNKQVLNYSEQLKSLENILKNPKQRGVLGEYWLEALLSQVLQPGQYKMQYKMGIDEATGKELIADAVVFINQYIVPIDAKFSLENYNRVANETNPETRAQFEREFKADVKKRIDETSKYVNPEKGTMEFAFMFIPAEGVYHNLLTSSVGGIDVNQQNLIEYAFSKHVAIVSPTSFFAYLQTVLMGLKALKIEQKVTEVIKQVSHLSKHINAYEAYHSKLGKNLGTTVNAYNDASNELKKIDKDVVKISDGESGGEIQVDLIGKPEEYS